MKRQPGQSPLLPFIRATDKCISTLFSSPILASLIILPLLFTIYVDNFSAAIIIYLCILPAVSCLYYCVRKIVLQKEEERLAEIAAGTSHLQVDLRAGKRTQLMAKFYELCKKNGYTDMSNDVHSLKAKVIAADLKLHYIDIVAFYEKAEKCYLRVQKEKEELQHEKDIEKQKRMEEYARTAVDGVLLITFSNRENSIRVYLRPDGSIYSCINSGSKIESRPYLTVQQGGVLEYKYNPSKTVYTGASSGNITMGGFHQTQATYSEKTVKTHTGYIEVSLLDTDFTVTTITMSEYVQERFKRDKNFQKIASSGRVYCTKSSDIANSMMNSVLAGGHDIYTAATLITAAADKKRLPYDVCTEIADLARRVAAGLFPPSDDEIYSKAIKLAAEETSTELRLAIETFQKISDYRDAFEQIKAVQKKYDEVLQKEKEQAIVKKEALRKKLFKIAKFAVPITIAVIVLGSWISKRNRYLDAVELMESGEYEQAITEFQRIGNFRDSTEKVLEIRYLQAEALLANESYDEAILAFQELEEYQDSQERVLEVHYRQAEALLSSHSYDEAIEKFQAIAGYSDAEERADEAKQAKEKIRLEDLCQHAIRYLDDQDYYTAIDYLPKIESVEEVAVLLKEAIYQEAVKVLDSQYFKTAYDLFDSISGYKDAEEYLEKCKYQYVIQSESVERNGALYSETIYEYSNRNLISKTQTFAKDHPEYTNKLVDCQEVYTYSKNNLCEKSEFYRNGKWQETKTFQYDSDGMLIFSTLEYPGNSKNKNNEFSYHYFYKWYQFDDVEAIYLLQQKVIYKNLTGSGDAHICIDYHYDSDGNVSRTEAFQMRNKKWSSFANSDSDMNINENYLVFTAEAENGLIYEYEYDLNYNLIQYRQISEDSTETTPENNVTSEYDSSGQLIQKTEKIADNSEIITVYEYDNKGLLSQEVSKTRSDTEEIVEIKNYTYLRVENF